MGCLLTERLPTFANWAQRHPLIGMEKELNGKKAMWCVSAKMRSRPWQMEAQRFSLFHMGDVGFSNANKIAEERLALLAY